MACLGWYLGGDYQGAAIEAGYDQAREDALLASIDWPKDGYRLFEIGTLDESCVDGWMTSISESNALFLRRTLWDELGGMDERFESPGGGLVNLDTYSRAMESAGAEPVVLLGEGSFHQVHGGIATNAGAAMMADKWRSWEREYQDLRGRRYALVPRQSPATLLGKLPPAALSRLVHSAVNPATPGLAPLGKGFDCGTWSSESAGGPDNPIAAALVALAHRELRAGRFGAAGAVARIARRHAPDESELQRLLSLTATWVDRHPADANRHLAMADACRILGEQDAAASSYRAALSCNPDAVQAHLALAELRMPGDNYLIWLERLYSLLAPETVIEIGVDQGASLALLRPPTVAVGIDPCPRVLHPLKTEAHIFAETSDDFFAQGRARTLLAGRPLSAGFIDGLHLYEQALRDFINLEACCGPRSVIVLHDTVPLDEATQSRTRRTGFHTGDVWKTVLCLRTYRPDLNVFTIPAAPTGLTVVTGLDATSRVLSERYDEAVARFLDASFVEMQNELERSLNMVPADWSLVESRLKFQARPNGDRRPMPRAVP